MGDNRDKIARFADRLVKLADDYRDDRASVAEDAKKADIDPAALGRLVSWMRKDRTKRAEQEAIDEQYRFLAGETETPATLPAEGMLSEAARLYRDKLSVRQVAGVLNVSTGKAFKLKALAALFTVHADVNTSVNTSAHDADGVITDASPKPDAETIAWAEKVAAELPREPQSTRPLKDFIAERRAASKITDASPKAPDASSTVTARAPVSTTGDAQGEGDGVPRGKSGSGEPAIRCGESPDELGCGDDAQHEHDGRDDRLGGEATTSRPEGAPNGLERPGHVAGAAGAGRTQQDDGVVRLHAHGGREPGAVAVQPDGPPGGGLGDRDGVGAGEDQRGVEQASTPPPTESLGAVARPSSAERVASSINPDEDDLKIPLFLTKAGQRASAPSKEK